MRSTHKWSFVRRKTELWMKLMGKMKESTARKCTRGSKRYVPGALWPWTNYLNFLGLTCLIFLNGDNNLYLSTMTLKMRSCFKLYSAMKTKGVYYHCSSIDQQFLVYPSQFLAYPSRNILWTDRTDPFLFLCKW